MYGQQQNGWESGALGDAPVSDLGLAIPLVGKIGSSLVPNLLKSVPVVGNLFAKDKNPQRMAANAKAYNDGLRAPTAIFSGTDGKSTGLTPLQFLLAKSPVANGGQAGWATLVAQKDAWSKYQALLAATGAKPLASLPPPTVKPAEVKPQVPTWLTNTLLDVAAGAAGGSYTPGPAPGSAPAPSGGGGFFDPSSWGSSPADPNAPPAAATGNAQIFGMNAKSVALGAAGIFLASKLLNGRRH